PILLCPLLRAPPSSPLFPYTTLFRSGQERHARIRGERRDCLREPLPGGSPVDSQACAGRIGEQRAAQLGLLVAEDDARAGTCCGDRKSTRLNSSHQIISYAVFCLKKK